MWPSDSSEVCCVFVSTTGCVTAFPTLWRRSWFSLLKEDAHECLGHVIRCATPRQGDPDSAGRSLQGDVALSQPCGAIVPTAPTDHTRAPLLIPTFSDHQPSSRGLLGTTTSSSGLRGTTTRTHYTRAIDSPVYDTTTRATTTRATTTRVG